MSLFTIPSDPRQFVIHHTFAEGGDAELALLMERPGRILGMEAVSDGAPLVDTTITCFVETGSDPVVTITTMQGGTIRSGLSADGACSLTGFLRLTITAGALGEDAPPIDVLIYCLAAQ